MTPAAKRALSSSIRALRKRLLRDLQDSTEALYRFALSPAEARLDRSTLDRRARLETWLQTQHANILNETKTAPSTTAATPAQPEPNNAAPSKEELLREVEKQAAFTLVLRLVILLQLEATGPGSKAPREPVLRPKNGDHRPPPPPTPNSGPAAQGKAQTQPADIQNILRTGPALELGSNPRGQESEESEDTRSLLQSAFDELAPELPKIFGPAGIAELIPISEATWQHVIASLNHPQLQSCWTDDMTLGWVYQYWNDPEREALDFAIKHGHSIQPHEIASKTQVFTDRYIAQWLLQNSLGPLWLGICNKNGWTAQVESQGVLETLESRRAQWRAKRKAEEVSPTTPMPLHGPLERQWAYFLPTATDGEYTEQSPSTIRDLKILDPAVGSGHFLVIAFDLLFAMYVEEAQHRGEAELPKWSKQAIVERILSHNLSGIDIDPAAVQIAAATLWLKARSRCPEIRLKKINLVASNFELTSLPANAPARIELCAKLEEELGISPEQSETLMATLSQADHLGSLLNFEKAMDQALSECIPSPPDTNKTAGPRGSETTKSARPPSSLPLQAARAILRERIGRFLAQSSTTQDLGLCLGAEQIPAGPRLMQMLEGGSYDLVIANPPYHSAGKLAADASTYQTLFPLGRADLFAAFILRSFELLKKGGISASVTLSNWMFLKAFADFRTHLFEAHALERLADLGKGSFSSGSNLISASAQIFRKTPPQRSSVALRIHHLDDNAIDTQRVERNQTALECHEGWHRFDPAALNIVPDWPLVYWWPEDIIRLYQTTPLFGERCQTRRGASTGNNARFLRKVFEVAFAEIRAQKYENSHEAWPLRGKWLPYIKGASGRAWVDNLSDVINWNHSRLELATSVEHNFGDHSLTWKICNAPWNHTRGVAYSTIGAKFSARAHRYHSVVDVSGASLVPRSPATPADLVCALNSATVRALMTDLNPTVNFQLADLKRAPFFKVADAESILAILEEAMEQHERHREASIEFKYPGPSPWRHAQQWAQLAVDRPPGTPLPEYRQKLDPEPPSAHLSFALGVVLGRFGIRGGKDEGILDPAQDDLCHALPAGLLFLDRTLDDEDRRDSLGHPAAAPLHRAWAAYGAKLNPSKDLRNWLAQDFFKDVHKNMYENRPIHWPLSSDKKNFVAWVNIHRFGPFTLQVLLSDHLHPARHRIETKLAQLRKAAKHPDTKTSHPAKQDHAQLLKYRDELQKFITAVQQCANFGPLPPDIQKCPPREQDACYSPDLRDGVRVNAAALWQLLWPQWKDPQSWWRDIARASGKKDYDWSHLARRYWPRRVDQKCRKDPSLAVAHGCFWRYHPARAWAWELRLQAEINPEFRLEEAPYRPSAAPSHTEPSDSGPADRDRSLEVDGMNKPAHHGPAHREPAPQGSLDHLDGLDQGSEEHRRAFLTSYPEKALAAVEKEALRRIGQGHAREPGSEMRLLETGLWSDSPQACWELEVRVSEKTKRNFYLRAPDEKRARHQFQLDHPDRVQARRNLMASSLKDSENREAGVAILAATSPHESA